MEKGSVVEQINGYHSSASKSNSKMSLPEMKSKSDAILQAQIDKLEPLDHILLENLQEIRNIHFTNVKFKFYEKYVNSSIIFSQLDMALVQSAFFSNLITFPELYGGVGVSK